MNKQAEMMAAKKKGGTKKQPLIKRDVSFFFRWILLIVIKKTNFDSGDYFKAQGEKNGENTNEEPKGE